MQDLMKISVNKNTEFSIIGIANVNTGKVKFQGLLNGVPFTQSLDYEKVRSRIVRAVQMNLPKESVELS